MVLTECQVHLVLLDHPLRPEVHRMDGHREDVVDDHRKVGRLEDGEGDHQKVGRLEDVCR